MTTSADYIAAAVLAILFIALAVNIVGGTAGAWAKKLFLGVSSASPAPPTAFSSGASAGAAT